MTEQALSSAPELSAPAPAPSLPRRLAAMLYDTFLVLPLIMLFVAVAMGVSQLLGYDIAESSLSPWIVRALALLCCVGFFAAFWLKGGQTLGMQAWRIRLVPLPGHELSFARAALRCCGAALSAGCLGLGYLWCLVDRHGRYWHDYLSGTTLELLPKKPKKAKEATEGPEPPSGAPQQ